MDERQRLYDELQRYRAMRDLGTDEAAIEAIDITIRETKERLTQLEQEEADRPGLCAEPGNRNSTQLTPCKVRRALR